MNQIHEKTDILILGAGIGGYEAYRTLAKKLKRAGSNKTITIVDQNNYFTFTPLLHEAATGAVVPYHCAIPLRSLVKTPHRFVKAKVEHVDPAAKIVQTNAGDIKYDYCVLALGSQVNYFGIPGAKEHTYHVRTLSGALRLQRDFISRLEDCNPEVNVTIVGGAFTGVEIAGQFSHFIKTDIEKLYPEKKVRVRLVQSNESLLPQLPPKVRDHVLRRLKKEKVEIFLNSTVKKVTVDNVELANGDKITSDFIIWTTGFANTAICYLDKNYCERDRVPVNAHLQHQQFNSLYAVGDIALITDPANGSYYPQLGEAAHKEGQYVSEHIIADMRHKKMLEFKFKSAGTIIPIGNWDAVAMVGPFTLFGPFAWWLRRTAYLHFFPGFVRKLKIAIDWTLHSLSHRYIIDVENES